MKAIAINSSPRMDKSNTSVILDPFLDGMRQAGAEVELFYTKKLNVRPCLGDFICWTKTPGVCHQKDDMQWLLPKMAAADVWVLATPLYIHGMSGPLKNLLDRIIPVVMPTLERHDGRDSHPSRRADGGSRKLVLVSNSGFWDRNNFDALIHHIEALAGYDSEAFAGALIRPHGPALAAMLEMKAGAEDVVAAATDAGRQLAEEGAIAQATLDTVSRDLLSAEDYMAIGNQNFQQAIDAGTTVG
jgi:multimeric flavodoxin WrbA